MRQLILAGLLLSAGLLCAQELTVGDKLGNFQLADLSGKTVTIQPAKGITAIVFVSTQCPVSNAYNDRMNAVYKEYSGKGVNFVFVNANRNESADDVRSHLAENKLDFVAYKDPNNALADKLNAQVTPEVYLLDSTGTLRYHGSIDDSRVLDRVRDQRLRKALDAMLAGKEVPNPVNKAFGCTIKRAGKSS